MEFHDRIKVDKKSDKERDASFRRARARVRKNVFQDILRTRDIRKGDIKYGKKKTKSRR